MPGIDEIGTLARRCGNTKCGMMRFAAPTVVSATRLRNARVRRKRRKRMRPGVVTINSAVGIEAMLHGKPVVLCGHADFHHCAVTVKTIDTMEEGVAQALAGDWPHEAYLYWYFVRHCLSPLRKTLVQDFLGKVGGAGFDVAQFGLK